MICYFRNAFIIGFLAALPWAAVAWVYSLIFEAIVQRPMVARDWKLTMQCLGVAFAVGLVLVLIGLCCQSYAAGHRHLRE